MTRLAAARRTAGPLTLRDGRFAAMLLLCVFALLALPRAARAGGMFDAPSAGYSPRVPLSAFSSPLSWFDPTRLHLSSTLSMGSSFGGTSSALSVTSLAYQFKAPLTMSVSLGNTFGFNSASGNGSQFFLEGFDLAWHPNKNSLFRVEMHNVRSPLQYGYGTLGGFPGNPATQFPY
jgi:hypothetical protein